MAMLVNTRSARRCCRGCYSDFGKSPVATAKTKYRRVLKRRERRGWQAEVRQQQQDPE